MSNKVEELKKQIEEMSLQIEAIKSELEKAGKAENSDEIGFLDQGWYVGFLGEATLSNDNNPNIVDRATYSATKEHALEIDKIVTTQRKIHSIARQLEPDWVADWNDRDQEKCYLEINHNNNCFYVDYEVYYERIGSFPFSKNIAEKMLHHANVLKTFD